MAKVKIEESRRFIVDSLKAAGAPAKDAEDHADLLVHADCAGHFSHGLNRLELYINDLRNGSVNKTARPVILKESPATAWVDGNNTLGATAATFCMDLAIKKAKEIGVGWVSAKQCNHFGMAGYWALKAEKEGLIGMAFTNSSPLLVPTRAKDRVLGTNPIGMAAPATGGDSLVVDMATTAVALGKIEIQNRKGEPIPKGWALDFDGKETTDTQVATESRRLNPLGGSEENSGYKGYCLSAMVEVFCSGLSGSNPTHDIPAWLILDKSDPPNLGQCFVAINPACFNPGFAEHVAKCLKLWRSMTPLDPSLPVLVPGDKEKINAEETKRRGTITYTTNQIETCMQLASELRIAPMAVE